MYYRLVILITVFLYAAVGVFPAENGESIYAPFVSHIKAEEKDGKVILTWKESGTESISVYQILRSEFPPKNDNIDNMEHIADIAPGILKFVDQPEPGREYWYSIISRLDNKCYKIIIPWRNSLGKPVFVNSMHVYSKEKTVKTKEAAGTDEPEIKISINGIPLPAICCTENRKLPELPLRINLTEKTNKSLLKIITSDNLNSVTEEPEPEILTADFAGFSTPAEKELHKVLSGSFKKGEWERANNELFKILAEYNTANELKNRILFYRGECFYFSSNYNSAFLSFLVSSDNYYIESSKWMKRIYKEVSSFYSGLF